MGTFPEDGWAVAAVEAVLAILAGRHWLVRVGWWVWSGSEEDEEGWARSIQQGQAQQREQTRTETGSTVL